jgi:NADH-quinone oxidoreductase subunit C
LIVTEAEALARIAEFPGVLVSPGATTLTVTVPTDQWAAFARFAKDTLRCHFFSFLSAVDWKEEGLEIIAWVEDAESRLSVLMKTRLAAGTTACPSIVAVYRGANWMERECFDMFGVVFEGHPDLRRILLGDDWVGHPLLKSYAVDTPYPPYR